MICVIADTHGDYSFFSHRKIKSLKKGDFLVVCGDFGFVWDGSPKETAVLKKIGAKKYTTVFINGSHDNSELLSRYPETDFCGGRARNICGNLYMLSSGHIFELGGIRAFAFGGGHDIESEELRPEADSAELEQGMAALEAAGNSVDYIFTHEPPASIEEFLCGTAPMSSLSAYFDTVRDRVSFKMWYFGKLHKSKLIPPKYSAVFDEPYVIM